MLRNTLFSFGLAFQNIRANLFHTFLSVLGIVIGVAALVAMLSFIDGLERFAKEQITKTTSLNTIILRSEPYVRKDGVRLKKDSFALLNYSTFTGLLDSLDGLESAELSTRSPAAVTVDTGSRTIGALVQAGTVSPGVDTLLVAGKAFSEADIQNREPGAIVNTVLAKQALGHERYAEILGQTLHVKDRELPIIGVTRADDEEARPAVSYPISLLSAEELRREPPNIFLNAAEVEQVTAIKEKVQALLKRQFPDQHEDIEVITNDFRLDQTSKGFFLFRIIMGLIVGISIVVGGVGVMNVLLISVTERTTEIGIRKAVGAKRRDIMRQFLAESVTVSAFGSILGLVVGVLATLIIIPIIKLVTDLPFEAVYTRNTFLTISIIAVLVGIIFGTYPALKASKLDPVEAIRRE
ncbi:MAG: ABC transporter permease [Bacteroidetes bacterium]|nr:MAG: ABC transporter permease [Bacteroidota bacterium]